MRGAEIIIHNAAFDVGFLERRAARASAAPAFAQHVAQVTDSLSMAREMFPGKSNSLDALCKRLEVDNANRTLHGALLDAGLLAEVYIRMTRGQDSLVIDAARRGRRRARGARRSTSARFELIVIAAERRRAGGARRACSPSSTRPAAARRSALWHTLALSGITLRPNDSGRLAQR